MSVAENLQMGADATDFQRGRTKSGLERVLALFPRLKERLTQRGGTLSGGEQQMLAIGRALMSRPRLLLLDEPSLGLAPLIARQIFDAIRTLNRQDGLTVLIVEQNANHALKLAHRGYVMVNGLITLQGTGAELLQRPEIRAAYLEGGRRASPRSFRDGVPRARPGISSFNGLLFSFAPRNDHGWKPVWAKFTDDFAVKSAENTFTLSRTRPPAGEVPWRTTREDLS